MKASPPVALRLARQTVHKIDAYVVKSRLACVSKGFLCLQEVVPAAYELEQIIVRSLNAYGQAVHAFGTQELERGEADAVRIALDSDLGIETDIAVELERVEYLDDPVRPVVAGSTAAEVYRVDLIVLIECEDSSI